MMKRISIYNIKGHLSAAVAEAESGHTIVITRHNRPVAQLAPIAPAHVHVGAARRGAALKPLLKQGTRGRYLAVLLDDRRGGDES